MTNDEREQPRAMAIPWPRWLWAAVDGLAAWMFLTMGHLGLCWMMRFSVAELEKPHPEVIRPPRAFAELAMLMPEPGLCLYLGISLLALAYARVAWARDCGLATARLFLWAVVVLEFLLLISTAPLIGLWPKPPGLPDLFWLDEVAFLLVALALCFCAFRFIKPRARSR